MHSGDTLSRPVDVQTVLTNTLHDIDGCATQGTLAINNTDYLNELNDPEASSEIIITAAAFSTHYRELAHMLPDNVTMGDLSLILEALSEEQSITITDLGSQRREALVWLRQPGIFSFEIFTPEQQKIAERLQVYVAQLNEEELYEVMRCIDPQTLESRGGARSGVLYKAPVVRKQIRNKP